MDAIQKKKNPASDTIFSAEDSELGERGEWRGAAKVHALLSVPDCGRHLTNALYLLGCGLLL